MKSNHPIALWLFNFLVSMLLLGASPSVLAGLKCEALNTATLFTFGKDVAALKVSSSTPIGTVLVSRQVDFTVACSLSSVAGSAELAYLKRKNLSALLGNGLTIYLTYNGERSSAVGTVSTGINVTNWSGAVGLPSSQWQQFSLSVLVEVVKTGATPATPTTAAHTIGLFGIDSRVIGSPATYFIQGGNSTTFTTETCQVAGDASFGVPLGSVTTAGSSGFGSGISTTSADKNFAVNLTCDAALSGAFDINMTLNGTTVAGQAANGVLALSGGGGAASGAGIQVLHGATAQPVTFGSTWKVGSFPLVGTAISVPFIARYYQTAGSVTPGVANGTMTYTVNYL